MTTTNQIFKAGQSSKSSAGQHLFLSGFLGNISMAWKMGLMAFVLFLGTLGISVSAYVGLQSLRYQFSNIYDFMLIPITSIQDAGTFQEQAQYNLAQLLRRDITAEERASSLAEIQTDNQSAEKIIARYDTEWVTTTSPQFTQDLKNAGKLDLQQQEVATLASYHTAYDAYKTAVAKYLATAQAGSPDANLADDAMNKLETADTELGKLIAVNNQFADFSNTSAQAAFQQALLTGVIVLIIGLALGIFLSYLIVISITSRLSELTHGAAAMQEGNLDQVVDVAGRDEVSLLGTAFNSMASQLKNLFGTLEQRVAEATHSLELAAEVGRSVSQVRALDVMLKDATEIIRSRFDLYYVQVYLTNPSQTALVLQAGTGTVGAELLERGHRLPLNTASINGRAAIEKRSVVVADTTASITFKPNPLLPDTRSEMAVPLLIGEKVVGVLDMQSQQANALNQGTLSAFEALAGQLAIAIQNATFLAEMEQARAEVEFQAGRQTRTNWGDYLDAIHKPEETGFVFEQNKITPMTQVEQSQPSMNENALTAPITVTGEALGNLVVEMEGQSPISYTSELVNTVARQVAQQIENLRLLENAERYRAEAEEASRRLTHEGWKEYVENTGESLSYFYDLREVRPYNNGNQRAEEAVTLPLKVRDEAVGKLAVMGIAPDDNESLDLAKAVADRLGAHIEGLRQYDQTQAALAQSERLFEASRRLTQATDLQQLVKAAVETLNIPVVNRAILGAFGYNAAGELESMTDIANWWNGTRSEVAAIGTSYSAKTLELLKVFLSDTPLFFNDTLNDERMGQAGLQVAKSLNIRSGAVLPLFLGTRQLGILMLQAEEPHNFTQDEIRLYSALAPQIATVVENRRQYEQAQHQAEREATLNVINQKIQGATTVEAVLQIAARELGHALGAPLTIAQLGMDEHGNGGSNSNHG